MRYNNIKLIENILTMEVSSSIYRDIVYRAKGLLDSGKSSTVYRAIENLEREHKSLGNLDKSITTRKILEKSYHFFSGKEETPYYSIDEQILSDGRIVVIF